MAKGTPVLSEEEAAILEALGDGMSTRQAAKKFNRAKSTIVDVAKRNGLDLGDRSVTKNAAIAKSCYASDARITLIGQCLDKGQSLLDGCNSGREFKDILIGIGIALDKRHLEEAGDGTGRGGELRLIFDKMGGGR